MKKITVIATVSMAVALTFTGCLDSLVEEESSSSNSLTFSGDASSFSISLDVSDVGGSSDYYHVRYFLLDGSSKRIKHGANYNGTVKTECTQSGYSGFDPLYNCTTTYNTASPVGDPSPSVEQITLEAGTTYSVVLAEESYSNGVEKEVGSLFIPN